MIEASNLYSIWKFMDSSFSLSHGCDKVNALSQSKCLHVSFDLFVGERVCLKTEDRKTYCQ